MSVLPRGGALSVMRVAERKNNSSRIAKIVLIVYTRKWIAESSQQVVKLERTNCKVPGERNIYSDAHVQGKRLGCGRSREGTSSYDKGANCL